MADDARDRRPGEQDEPTQEHRPVPDEGSFDPTLAPPSDPFVDDTEVTPAVHDYTYDPTGYGDYQAPEADAAGTWSGRAGVPQRGADDTGWVDEAEAGRQGRWYLPVVFGIVLVLLLGLLGLGLWLALRDDNQTPVTPPTTAPAPTSVAPSPTSASPTPSPSSASPSASTVALPDLTGVSYDQAAALLTSRGLVPVRVDTVSDSLPAGTVIRTDPAGPADVPVGAKVQLFVAVAPPPTTAPASPTASPSA